MKTYKEVHIKSEDDLPKEKGVYWTQITDSCKASFHFDPNDKDDIDFFMGNVMFYLLPLESVEEPLHPVCRDCGHQNSVNCNTCRILNPQYE